MGAGQFSDPQSLADTNVVAASGLAANPSQVDLERILVAWNAATEKLQQTHRTLRDEVKRLTDELEIKNRELARKNRLADLGQMASHIAHEVRNSLMPITLYSSLLRRGLVSEDAGVGVLDKLDAGLKSLDSTVNDLLHFTSEREPQVSAFSLYELSKEVCFSLAPQCDAQEIEVKIGLAPDLRVHADQEMLRRALLNLVLNSLEAMPGGGCLEITGEVTSRGTELVVCDSGPGVACEDQSQLFEPFYTTKGTGTGLGLAIVERIMAAHGGAVGVRNVEPQGAVFSLVIPVDCGEDLGGSVVDISQLAATDIGSVLPAERKAVA